MASRILGMGDVLSLIEKAESAFDTAQAEKMEKRFREQKFDLEDFLGQFEQIRKMGSVADMLKMIPGMGKLSAKAGDIDPKDMAKSEAIIRSMTPEERRDPDILNARRRIRIARGSGTKVQDVNVLIKQFEQTKQMMKQFGGRRAGKGARLPFNFN